MTFYKLRYVILFCSLLCCVSLYSQQKNKTHTVKQGETIESIAKQYNLTAEELRKANPNNSGMIFPGLYLLIPEKKEQPEANQPAAIVKEDKDRIELKEGSFIECTITEVNNTTVYFMQQDENKVYSMPKTKILYVKYEDGTKDYFKKK